MPGLAVPGLSHHITQRGDRRTGTCFCRDDGLAYLNFIVEIREKCGIDAWAYCLLLSHVHLLPLTEDQDRLFRKLQLIDDATCGLG